MGVSGEGAGGEAQLKEAVRQVLDSVIRHPWAKAAGVVKKTFGREQDEGVRQGMVGDSALFAGRIATLYGIAEKLLQEFEEHGPERAEMMAGNTRIIMYDLDSDTVLVAVIDLEADHAESEAVLSDARARLKALG